METIYPITYRRKRYCFCSSIHKQIFTMVSYFLRWTLLKFFSSIPDEQSQQKVRRLGRITCAVINTSNEVKCPLLWEFWINNFSRRILERVLVGNIVNIRKECLFFWVHGVWIVARNKQITRDLFVPRYDSYPMNPEKKTLIPLYNTSYVYQCEVCVSRVCKVNVVAFLYSLEPYAEWMKLCSSVSNLSL